MTGQPPKTPEPQPPPFVRVKLFGLDISGSGTLGIGAVIVVLLVGVVFAYLMRDGLPALLQAAGEILNRLSRSRLWS